MPIKEIRAIVAVAFGHHWPDEDKTVEAFRKSPGITPSVWKNLKMSAAEYVIHTVSNGLSKKCDFWLVRRLHQPDFATRAQISEERVATLRRLYTTTTTEQKDISSAVDIVNAVKETDDVDATPQVSDDGGDGGGGGGGGGGKAKVERSGTLCFTCTALLLLF